MKSKAIGFVCSDKPDTQKALEIQMREAAKDRGVDLARTLAARRNDPRRTYHLFTLADRLGATTIVVPHLDDLGDDVHRVNARWVIVVSHCVPPKVLEVGSVPDAPRYTA